MSGGSHLWLSDIIAKNTGFRSLIGPNINQKLLEL